MRTRAYRPEVPGYLEERSLLSGGAGLPTAPVVLLRRQFSKVGEQIHLGFQLFARDRAIDDLHDKIFSVGVMIPFGRVDGLGASINGILDRMERDLDANVPFAIRTARTDVLAVTRAAVQVRVQAGDVVIR